MKTPLSWISLYTPLQSLLATHSAKSLAHEYSIHTAEIEGNIEESFIDKVVIGKVLSCEKHPESKKLSIVEVDLGKGEKTTILTGALNISEATYVPVATLGARLSDDFVIGERMMAGMMSRGMICGADEIGLSQTPATGIMILEEMWDQDFLESKIGTSIYDLELPFPGINGEKFSYTLRDVVFEIDNKFITNRPDLFSIYGNAREWHAIFDIPTRAYAPRALPENLKPLNVRIETTAVRAYEALEMGIDMVKNSPFALTLMMERADLTAKLDIVDITNCMMTEFGQPMHAFDADTIDGDIVVRMARDGEQFVTLTDIDLILTSQDIVIADQNKILALAGIIGGKSSAVSESTTRIIWESATFDPIIVRLSAQRHGIRTDASTRFEKSLDPLLPSFSLSRIFDYLDFLGKKYSPLSHFSYLDPKSVKHIEITVSREFLSSKIGLDISHETIDTILTRLGFEIISKKSESITLKVPSWRATKDINIEEDIVEEIARIHGYEYVPPTPLSAELRINQKNHELLLREGSLLFFRDSGFHEVYNYSFTNEKIDQALGYTHMNNAVGIQNAFNESYTHMRRSLAAHLFENIRDNIKHSKKLSFFEIGKVYTKDGETSTLISGLLQKIDKKPFAEKKILAGVTTGQSLEELRQTLENYLLKQIYHLPPLHQGIENPLPFLHPNMSGEYREGEHSLLRFGSIHPETALYFELPTDTLYFEINYEYLVQDREESDRLRFHPISRYQSIPRELNFVMDERKNTGDIATIIDSLSPWIQEVTVDSIYVDAEKIGTGKKSVNFSFILSSEEGTLSDKDALELQNTIIETMKQHNCHIRQ